jgi:hypothetical protein
MKFRASLIFLLLAKLAVAKDAELMPELDSQTQEATPCLFDCGNSSNDFTQSYDEAVIDDPLHTEHANVYSGEGSTELFPTETPVDNLMVPTSHAKKEILQETAAGYFSDSPYGQEILRGAAESNQAEVDNENSNNFLFGELKGKTDVTNDLSKIESGNTYMDEKAANDELRQSVFAEIDEDAITSAKDDTKDPFQTALDEYRDAQEEQHRVINSDATKKNKQPQGLFY